jgi:hypothetical protein
MIKLPEDITKKGQEGTSMNAPIVDLSPSTLKDASKTAPNVLVAVGVSALTSIASIVARAGIDKIIHDREVKDIAEGKTPKIINPDYLDGGMIAGGVGLASLSKNSLFRAAMVGISAGGLVNLIVRKVPRISQPFAKSVEKPAMVVEW